MGRHDVCEGDHERQLGATPSAMGHRRLPGRLRWHPDHGVLPRALCPLDPGEIVWTWVPFEDDHRKGKDRPVLLIGRDGRWLLGVMLTTKLRGGADSRRRPVPSRVSIGVGPWDRQRRPSEVKVDRIIRVKPRSGPARRRCDRCRAIHSRRRSSPPTAVRPPAVPRRHGHQCTPLPDVARTRPHLPALSGLPFPSSEFIEAPPCCCRCRGGRLEHMFETVAVAEELRSGLARVAGRWSGQEVGRPRPTSWYVPVCDQPLAAVQTLAMAHVAAIEDVALEDGTIVEQHRGLGHQRLDAPALVSDQLGVSDAVACSRVGAAVDLVTRLPEAGGGDGGWSPR